MWALNEDNAHLYLFGTVNINKVVFPDKNCTFSMYFTPQISFLRYCKMLPT